MYYKILNTSETISANLPFQVWIPFHAIDKFSLYGTCMLQIPLSVVAV